MKHFRNIDDVTDPMELIHLGLRFKHKTSPANKGIGKTLGLIFFNPSLRTRISTEKAAVALGMYPMILNVGTDSWTLETKEGVVMNGNASEHIKEAAQVIGCYCDIVGVRSFPSLNNRDEDEKESVLSAFVKHAGVPIINLESATAHPLQALADMITIYECGIKRPKVVLRWAPHVKALPQSVPNSFLSWAKQMDFDLTLNCPQGMELAERYTEDVSVSHEPEQALEDANFVYVKNWSSYSDYGRIHHDDHWTFDTPQLQSMPTGRVMHCLPVRRNVVISDAVLDGEQSIVIPQAHNRLWSAMAVLDTLLSH